MVPEELPVWLSVATRDPGVREHAAEDGDPFSALGFLTDDSSEGGS